jgi:hypothetical protein
MRLLILVLGIAACFPTPPAYQQPNQAAIQQQQRAAFAQSMGYPTRKSPAELEAMIQQQTKDFTRVNRQTDGRLETPMPYVIEGVKGTCYTTVMRLDEGATWGLGAEAGLRFDFTSPTGHGSGGPGLAGPGAVASVGCAEADGPITLTMAPMVGTDQIGQGPYKIELWSHALSKQEATHLEADKQRQIAEQREFAAREKEKQRQKETAGCSKCDARYQGCIGAGRTRNSCQSDYRSCAFEEVGSSWPSACPSPR